MITGWRTLFYKEVLRFWKVSFQTVAAPVLTAVLYLLIFGHVLDEHVKVFERISYAAFLVPASRLRVRSSATTRPRLSMAMRPHSASASSR